VLASLAFVVVCARSDYRVRERARAELDKVSLRLAAQAAVPGQADLSWLSLYPEVRSAVVRDGSNQLGVYQSPLPQLAGGADYAVTQERQGIGVELVANLPGWTACRTELPLLILSLVLLVLAAPAPSLSGSDSPLLVVAEDDPLTSPSSSGPGNLVLELDSDLRIQRVSRGVESYGYSAEDLLGSPMDKLVKRFHPLHHDSMLGVAHARGGQLDSLVSSSSVQDAEGTLEKVVVTLAPSGGSSGGELQARYSRLQQLCQAICDNARDSILIVDRAATVVYANGSFRAALAGRGGPGQALLNRLRPSHRLAFTNCLQAAIEGAPPSVLEFALEEPATAILEGAFHGLKVSGDVGQATLAVGIFRDVSEARRLAQELETARQRAGHSQKIEALGRMAGGVAHDFNNLLATIVFNLEAAKANLEADNPTMPYLEEMELAAGKACSVTRQLLLYSRKKPAEPRLVSCHEAIRDAVRLTHGMRGSVRLETRLEANKDQVFLDDGQLDQVLLNLLVNAKDALGRQGTIEISTENRRDGDGDSSKDFVLLRVKDDGPGIPKEIQSKIFEPYFTTKEVGKGTGLGLSTAVAIIEKAGGQLTVVSSSAGTVFEILLPVAGQVVPKTTPVARVLPAADGERRVLLVEDESSIRNLLQRLLQQRGYSVTSAATGTDAAKILSAKQGFDLLLTDLVLPGVSGPDLAKVFQKTHPGCPVLFMSGFPGDTLDETDIGDNSRFLAKPFSHEQLLATLRLLLGEPVA
jgi:signal transduction histidine kinase